MSMQHGRYDNTGELLPWDPQTMVREVHPLEARYSRGLMRSTPERWFPGFEALWTPLAHSFGLDLRLIDAEPTMLTPEAFALAFVGTVDDEPLMIAAEESACRIISDAFIPAAGGAGPGILLEYLARRLLSTLALSWSGPQSSLVRFNRELDPGEVNAVAGVKLLIEINGLQAAVFVRFGRLLADRLDGLWRRQVSSTARAGGGEFHIEIANLAVPPAMLVEYIKSGAAIDLERPVSDLITLSLDSRPWMSARLCQIQGNLGVEIVQSPVPSFVTPPGTTRVSIEFGHMNIDGNLLAELSQVGAIWDTGAPMSDRVGMVVNGETVAAARLCTVDNRLAISVE